MVDILIESKVNLELCSPLTHETPLLTAIRNGFSTIATKLIRAGAKVNSSNYKGDNNVLVAALLAESIPDSLLLLLIEKGAKFTDEPVSVSILEGPEVRVRFELDNPDAAPEDWIRDKAFHMVVVENTEIECTCGNDCSK
jgi:hypothetical protein